MRQYWAEAVARIPGLRFTVEGVYQGVDTVVVNYRNQGGNLVNEVLTFPDREAIEGHGTDRVCD